jgi:hypothetical protein
MKKPTAKIQQEKPEIEQLSQAELVEIVCKTYMTRVEGENTRLRHYLARLHRKTLCYSKSEIMLQHSIRLLVHYLKFWDVPVPYTEQHSFRKRSHFL